MKHGGKRPGSGRKPGAENKVTREIKAVIDEVSERLDHEGRDGITRVVAGLFTRAMGGGDVPPDVAAAKVLLEMRFGRAKESVEVESKGPMVQQIFAVPVKRSDD